MAAIWWEKFDDTFSRFDRILACDGRTDGRTDRSCMLNGRGYEKLAIFHLVLFRKHKDRAVGTMEDE